MSVEATIETEYGEKLLLWRTDGFLGGNGIVAFLRSLLIYCDADDVDFEETREWFTNLDSISEIPLCELAKPLLTGHYFGHWDYGEDEYEHFSNRSRDLPLSEAEFKQTIQKLRKIWVPAKDMLNMADGVIHILTTDGLNTTSWLSLSLEEIINDFHALKEACKIATRVPACKLRIQFS